MSSPAEEPTVVLVVAVFPTGEPGKIKVMVNQAGQITVNQDEAAYLLGAASQTVQSGALKEVFPPTV